MENLFNCGMKKGIVSAALIMLCTFCFAQNTNADCSKFRTGNFQYIDSSKVVMIKRTKHIQEELVINTRRKTRFKIRWVEDCAYEIKQVWTNSKPRRKMKGSVTRVNIIKAYDKKYDYACACKDSSSFNSKGTMYLIR